MMTKRAIKIEQNVKTRTIDSVLNKYNLYDPEITFNNHYVRIYNAFKKEFGNPVSVLHPCCFADASPSKSFDNVTYVDDTEYTDGRKTPMVKMREFGLKAFEQDIRDYKPTEEHDLLIFVRPGNSVAANPEWATQHLKNSGLVLTEKSYGDAERMYAQPTLYELCGGICDGEPDIFDSKSKGKPAKAFRFNKNNFINFRDELYENNNKIDWLVFKKK